MLVAKLLIIKLNFSPEIFLYFTKNTFTHNKGLFNLSLAVYLGNIFCFIPRKQNPDEKIEG